MSDDGCYRCGFTHPTDGTSCSDARRERAAAMADQARAIVAEVVSTHCSHGVPLALCVEHTKAVAGSRRADDTEEKADA